MAQYDLTNALSEFMDLHLVFPLLEFLSTREIYRNESLTESKYQLLQNTNMVDFTIDVFHSLHPDEDPPDTLHDKRNEVVRQLTLLQERSSEVITMFSRKDVADMVEKHRDSQQLWDYLMEQYQFDRERLDDVFHYGKFMYDVGNYAIASTNLDLYRNLAPADSQFYSSAQWGKLASEILQQNWDEAMEELDRLKDNISAALHLSYSEILVQRAWLIHWGLFVYFNHPQGRDSIIDVFLYQKPYLNAIQTMCPHILRYITTAVVISKRRRDGIKELIKVLQQESYKDPITEFVESLYVNFDFDEAQAKLKECKTVIENDFFIVGCLDEFTENARLIISEIFCRIHQRIEIDMLADNLNMEPAEAEKWVVNMIRLAHLDAKIDSKNGYVVMGGTSVPVYQKLIDKTKDLHLKANSCCQKIDKKLTLGI